MNEFINYLIRNLVDNPDDVNVKLVNREKGILVEVRVAPTDIAKVIGHKGRIINSLRTIASIVGARFGKRVYLELIEEGSRDKIVMAKQAEA